MLFNRLSLVAFAFAFLSIVLVLMKLRPFGLLFSELIKYGFIGFGMLGFVFSMLSIWLDKKKSNNTLTTGNNPIFFIGSAIVMFGVGFQLMHWPFATILILGGVLVAGLSFILPQKDKSNNNDDLLDS